MKSFYKVMKVIAIIAAIIGIVYVVAAYGDKIVAWAKKTIGKIFGKRTRLFDIDEQAEGAEENEDDFYEADYIEDAALVTEG